MTERFSGRITLDEGDEVEVDLEFSNDEVRLATESADIGIWARQDCEIRDKGDGVYDLIVDGDVVSFVPVEDEAFRSAVQGSNGTGPSESGVTLQEASPGQSEVAEDPGEGSYGVEDESDEDDPVSDGEDDGFFVAVEPSEPVEVSEMPPPSDFFVGSDDGEESDDLVEVVDARSGGDAFATVEPTLDEVPNVGEVEPSEPSDTSDRIESPEINELAEEGRLEADGLAPELGVDEESAEDEDAESDDDRTEIEAEATSLFFVDEAPASPSAEESAESTSDAAEDQSGQPASERRSLFDSSEADDEQGGFEAVPVPDEEATPLGGPAWIPETKEDVDYEELAAALEELAEEQSVQSEEMLEEIDEAAAADETLDDPAPKSRPKMWFRKRSSPEEPGDDESAGETAAEEDSASPESPDQSDSDADERAEDRTRGWFQDPVVVGEPPPAVEEPVDEEVVGPKVRSSTERLAAAVGALKKQRSLTPAEQAIAEAEGQSPSVISTDEVMESQRSLRKTNVVRRLTWDLVRKVGAGVLLGLGIAVLVFLFPNAWEVLTRDPEPTVVVEDPPTSTTVDDAVAPTTTIAATGSTAPPASSTTTTTSPAIEPVFDLSRDDFFARWNELAVPIDGVLAFAVYPPPGEFENEFYPYLSMTGTIGLGNTIQEFAVVVDPTGPSDSDRLAIQALGVAIAVVEPGLTGQERAELLATLGLDVRQPQLAGIDAAVERGPHRYELVFDDESTLLTLSVSPAGITLP